jgi:DNA-binding protein HU-beta
MALTKAQLVGELADNTGLTRKQIAEVLDALAGSVEATVQAVDSMTIPGVCRIRCVLRNARKARNPATGESIKVPAKVAVSVRPVKSLKEAAPSVQKARRVLAK